MRLLKYILLFFAFTGFLSFTVQSPVKKGNLKVIVNNIRSNTGQVGVSIYNSSIGFPNHSENAVQSVFVKINGGTAEYTFTNIDFGTYGVCAFHDENNDKTINA